MGNVCDVYTYFPQAIFQFADGESIIKVFGILRVDGEGSHISEVLAFGNFFIGYFSGDFVRSFFYRRGVDIRQSEFGKDGVHLCGVVARFAQDVDDLPDGVFRLVGPFHYFHDGFVSRLSAFQLFFGDEDVIGKRTVFRHQEGV